MSHLTDEQLGARLDGMQSAADAAAAEQHLGACAECRERLAALSELDASLAGALTHDPGEAYFASFADRVGARIAAESPAVAAAPARSGGWFGWWHSPRHLAWAGAAAGVLAVSALAYVLTRDGGADRFASQVAPPTEVGTPAPTAARDEAAPLAVTPAPGEAPAAGTNATEPPAANAGAASARDAGVQRKAAPAPVASAERRALAGRVQEMRTLSNGEQVPVERHDMPVRTNLPPASPIAPAGEAARVVKPQAQPMAAQAQADAEVRRTDSAPAAGAVDRVPPTPALAPAPSPAPAAKYLAPAAPPAAASQGKTPRFDPRGFVDKPRTLVPTPGATTQSTPPVTQSEKPAFSDTRTLQSFRSGSPVPPPAQAVSSRVCGEVRDVQGRAIAGATVTVTESGSSVRTAERGGFCIDLPSARVTVSVLAVGYLSARYDVSAADASKPFVISLQPVQALGQPAFPTRIKPQGLLGGASTLDEAMRQAREAVRIASRDRSGAAWDRAAGAWEQAASLATDESVAAGVRRDLASARMSAWRAEATSTRRSAAMAAVEACIARATPGPALEQAKGWKAELER